MFLTVIVTEVIVLADSVNTIFVILTSGMGTDTLSLLPILFNTGVLFKFEPKPIVDTIKIIIPITKIIFTLN